MNEKLEKEFRRKVYDKILWWKENKAPNYALFLKGASNSIYLYLNGN